MDFWIFFSFRFLFRIRSFLRTTNCHIGFLRDLSSNCFREGEEEEEEEKNLKFFNFGLSEMENRGEGKFRFIKVK